MEAVADETINTEEMAAAAESAAASQAEEPVAEDVEGVSVTVFRVAILV